MGTSLEGFEEQITGFLLAIEARKKDKKKREVGSDEVDQVRPKRLTGVEESVDIIEC